MTNDEWAGCTVPIAKMTAAYSQTALSTQSRCVSYSVCGKYLDPTYRPPFFSPNEKQRSPSARTWRDLAVDLPTIVGLGKALLAIKLRVKELVVGRRTVELAHYKCKYDMNHLITARPQLAHGSKTWSPTRTGISFVKGASKSNLDVVRARCRIMPRTGFRKSATNATRSDHPPHGFDDCF